MDDNATEIALRNAGLDDEQVRFTATAISHAAYQMAANGRVPLQAMILSPRGEGNDPALMMLACPLVEDDDTKNMFMETVRYMAHRENSETVGILMEAWTAPDGTHEEIAAMLEKYGSVGAMPGAGEEISVMVNAVTGCHQASIVIERSEDGSLKGFSDVKVVTDSQGEIRGRMMHSRYTPDEVADPAFAQRTAFMDAYLQGRMVDIAPDEGEEKEAKPH